MMTQRLEVSILAAPLAAIDRRALSQAWYTALRLASRGQRISDGTRPRHRVFTPAPARTQNATVSAHRTEVETRPPRATPTKPTAISGDEETQNALRRRARCCALAQRIERAFGDSSAHPRRATFSMGQGNARVHVILQTRGTSTTLLALCRPELRTVVARALAQARFALAARGIVVEMPR
jgi:hypothetical protein